MGKLERDYQPQLIERIKKEFPGCIVLKNDSSYMAGIPDWTIFFGPKWATLEIKRKKPTASSFEPNQEWYIEKMNDMGFAACIYPENEEEILNALRQTFASCW